MMVPGGSKVKFLWLALLMGASPAGASQLTYTPVNPSFGGNPFNSNHLLGIANAINTFKEPVVVRDPLADVGATVTRSLLSRINQQINNAIFGEGAAQSGQFTIDQTVIDFQRTGDQVRVQITNNATGSTTVIDVPVIAP